jgi:multidrug resistance efflux pump
MSHSDPQGTPSLKDRVRSLRLGDPGAAPRRSPARGLPWALCVILLLVTALFGYRAYRVGPAPAPAPKAEQGKGGGSPSTGGEGASTAAPGDVVLPAKGYVTAVHTIQISPKVGGMLVYVHPNLLEGALFKKGEVLARLEDVDYKAERDQALYALRSAEEKLEELEAGNRPEEIEQARAELEEQERMLKQMKLDADRTRRTARSPGVIPPREYEQIVFGSEAQQKKVNRLRFAFKLMEIGPRIERKRAGWADVKQARALLAKAQWRLDNTVIRAPITGIILTKKAEENNIVNPSAFSSGISASLCEMADLQDVEIDLTIQERDIAKVFKGQLCSVMPEAYQAHKPFLARHPQGYAGYVSRLMPTADRAKGAVPVRVKIPPESIPLSEAGVYLRPDTGAHVYFKNAAYKGKK